MTLTKEFEIADTTFKRTRGLMFRSSISKPLLFIMPSESAELSSIHSLFVFFPFDAVFLNSKGVVVDIRERIKPFTLKITPAKPAKYILEMEAGGAKRRKIRVGDRHLTKVYI
ncbi:MAG: DUF192 domain-containing protein [Candidatus Micrarchaeota archaeon]|nr:DUF192 domain-containing protein [Candidatus Micrarchaeota archaeon]